MKEIGGLRAGDQYTDAKPEEVADESPFAAQDCPSHSALLRLHGTSLWPTTCLVANSGPVQQGDRTGVQTPIQVNVSCGLQNQERLIGDAGCGHCLFVLVSMTPLGARVLARREESNAG